jgi:hypothetical protein
LYLLYSIKGPTKVMYRSCQLFSISANNTEHLYSSVQNYQNQTPVLTTQVKLVCTFVINLWQVCEIWNSHNSAVEDSNLLACDTVSMSEWFLTFWRIQVNWGQAVQEEFFLGMPDPEDRCTPLSEKGTNWLLHNFKNARAMEQSTVPRFIYILHSFI